MNKEIYYNKDLDGFYIREADTENIGQKWGPCPYDPETQSDKIEKLSQTYTNGYLAAEWRNEAKAKKAFLKFADIAMTYLSTSKDSYEKLVGDLSPDYQGMIFRNPMVTARYIGSLAGNVFEKAEQLGLDYLFQLNLGHSDEEGEQGIADIIGLTRKTRNTKNLVMSSVNAGREVKNVVSSIKESKVLDYVEDVKNKQKLGKVADKAKDLGAEYFSVWASAVVSVYYRKWEELVQNYGSDLDQLSGPEIIEEMGGREQIEKEIVFEARLNSLTASIMETLAIPVVVPIKKLNEASGGKLAPVLLSIAYLYLKLIQSVSAGFKEAYRKYLEDKEKDIDHSWSEILATGGKVFLKALQSWQDAIGDSRMYHTVPFEPPTHYNPDEEIEFIVVERDIDAPGIIEGLKSFLEEDAEEALKTMMDNKFLVDSENLGELAEKVTMKKIKKEDIAVDLSEFFTRKRVAALKIKIINDQIRYIGTVEMIGKLYQQRQDSDDLKGKEKDMNFIAYYNLDFEDDGKNLGDKRMKAILRDIFKDNEKRIATTTLKEAYDYFNNDTSASKLVRNIDGSIKNQILIPGIIVDYEGKLNEYLNVLKQNFGQKYCKKVLRERTTINIVQPGPSSVTAGTGANIKSLNFKSSYQVKSIELIEKKAAKLGVDFEADDLSYEQVLKSSSNQSFLKNNLAANVLKKEGQKYDSLIIEIGKIELVSEDLQNLIRNLPFGDKLKGLLSGSQPEFFTDNYALLYGSAADDKSPDLSDKDPYEFFVWKNTSRRYPESDGSKKIFIEGKEIGTSLKRRFKQEGNFDNYSDFEYLETFEKEDGRKLRVIYNYHDIRNPTLNIRYRYAGKGPWNKITIKLFDMHNEDFGIKLPDKLESISGSQSAEEINFFDNDFDEIEVEDAKRKGRGKLKYLGHGYYIKTANIEEKEAESKEYKTYVIQPRDTLSVLAEEFLGSKKRWREILSADEQTFTEEEAKKLQVGDELLIPKKKKKQFEKHCKYCKYPQAEEVANYLYYRIEETVNKQEFDYIKGKLAVSDFTWYKMPKGNNFLEKGKGYYKWYNLTKNNGDWDYGQEIKTEYRGLSCELAAKMKFNNQIWIDIYYGYLGARAGFKEEELLRGPGLKQVKAGFADLNNETWRKRFKQIGEVNFCVDLDNPQEKQAVQIGIDLWEKAGEEVTKEDILDLILEAEEEKVAKELCPKYKED